MFDALLARIRSLVPRPTIRLRLTLLYGALFVASGAALLAATFLLTSRATADPVVVTGPHGEIFVTFTGAPGPLDPILGAAGDSGFTVHPQDPLAAPPSPEDLRTQAEQMRSLAVHQHAAELNQLVIWSGVALTLMALLSLGIGWFVAGRVLSPLRTMTANVRQISATNLHQHLALAGPNDELKELGQTFNDLLSRLDASFAAQRQFIANASHELRTPLARQRTLIQVALADPALSAASLRDTAERVLVAGGEQERLIDALFTLARGEQGLESRENVDLMAITVEVLRARREERDRHGLRLEPSLDAAHTSGEPRLIERLVTNLVDNATRYNTAGGWVAVATHATATAATLRVTNSGPIVPSSELDRLFQPFQRMGTDRTRRGEGWGLGLSIVQAIATAHNANVVAQARPDGGLDVVVRFPIAAAASAT